MEKLHVVISRISIKLTTILLLSFIAISNIKAQTTIAAGSFIIDMGVSPQTIAVD